MGQQGYIDGVSASLQKVSLLKESILESMLKGNTPSDRDMVRLSTINEIEDILKDYMHQVELEEDDDYED